MANTVIHVWYPASGESLKLHLYPAAGGAKANTAENLTQPDAVNQPYLYQVTITDNLAGWHKAYILPQAGSVPIAGGDVYLNPDAGPYAVGLRAAPPIIVDQLTEAAKQSLGSITVAFALPAWEADRQAFDRPITQGDDYLGDLAIRIPIANWPGRELLTAAVITLTAKRISLLPGESANTFAWTGAAESNGSGGVDLVFTPTSVQTDVTAGTYLFDVQCTWTSPSEKHTVVGPKARLEIAEDITS